MEIKEDWKGNIPRPEEYIIILPEKKHKNAFYIY